MDMQLITKLIQQSYDLTEFKFELYYIIIYYSKVLYINAYCVFEINISFKI